MFYAPSKAKVVYNQNWKEETETMIALKDFAYENVSNTPINAGDRGISTAGVNQLDETKNGVKIYPNPASNYFVVDADNVTELELINSSGVTVKKLSNLGDNPTVDIATLKAGIYLVKIKISNKITTHRIIVE